MNKLDHKKIGSVKVTKAVGRGSYQSELPPQMRIHAVFHVMLLDPYKSPADPQRKVEPPEVEDIDGEINWVVREVADPRVNRQNKIVEYLVL
jgi:hypothetical protein